MIATMAPYGGYAPARDGEEGGAFSAEYPERAEHSPAEQGNGGERGNLCLGPRGVAMSLPQSARCRYEGIERAYVCTRN